MTSRDMLGRAGVVTVDEARGILDMGLHPLPLDVERLPITAALGRVLSSDVVTDRPLPEFPRSTMDGYAVKARDTFGASDNLPALVAVVGEVLMGEEATQPVDKGQALRISTGGMLPPGADAVVMLEQTSPAGDDAIEVYRPVAPGENVVQPGEDIKAGETLLTRGHRLRPQDLGALAGVGATEIDVFRRVRVAIINTGNEIVEAGSAPRLGQVRDINSYNLMGLIQSDGGVAVRVGIIRDEYESIRAALGSALKDADVVAITGGSSVGTRDLTARVISDMGGPGVLVHGVSVKPGKPVILGVASGKPVFGLPGHPVAVSVSYELFIRPVLMRLSGEIDPIGLAGIPPVRVVSAKMTRNYSSSQGREDHLRVAIERIDGELYARPILGKSGLITTLVRAHGTVVVPLSKIGLSKGETVEVRLFD